MGMLGVHYRTFCITSPSPETPLERRQRNKPSPLFNNACFQRHNNLFTVFTKFLLSLVYFSQAAFFCSLKLQRPFTKHCFEVFWYPKPVFNIRRASKRDAYTWNTLPLYEVSSIIFDQQSLPSYESLIQNYSNTRMGKQ